MRILERQDLIEILYGCTILGTGGGGSLDDGIAEVDAALDAGKTFRLATFDELDGEDIIGTPYACGAISPLTEEEVAKYAGLPVMEESFYLLALRQLEGYLGKEVKGVISTELGGGNTATAFYCGAMTDRYIVDGDPAGRSVPALQHTTYYLKGVPICPMSVTNQFGEGAVITNVVNDERAEELVRALAVVSQNTVAVVDHVNTAEVLKDAVIQGAISHAQKIGKAFLDTRNAGLDYVNAVVEAGAGKFMFAGTVIKSAFETRDGYTYGDTEIAGTGEYEGETLHIWYQNENIISWRNGEYFVTVPDLICMFNLDEKMPQLNPYAKVGDNAAVIALPSPAEWATPEGIDLLGPRSFGYDVDYTPYC
ncbi:MAG: DUF917 domain-containing protein [Eubacteriales bacterium]